MLAVNQQQLRLVYNSIDGAGNNKRDWVVSDYA